MDGRRNAFSQIAKALLWEVGLVRLSATRPPNNRGIKGKTQ